MKKSKVEREVELKIENEKNIKINNEISKRNKFYMKYHKK